MAKRLSAQFRLKQDGTKVCRTCLEHKNAADFFPKKGAVEGLTNDCRVCISVRGKANYELTGDRQRAKAREWLQNNKERRRAYYDATREHHNAVRRARRLRYAQRFRDLDRARTLADPLRWRKAQLREHGMTLADYDAMLVSQSGVCAICGGPPNGKDSVYHVDHSHETGQIRGLLCFHCNHGLGKFRDSPAILQRAISYLTRP